MRRVRNDGADRRLLEMQRLGRRIVWGVIPASLSLTRDEDASDDNKKSTKRNVRRTASSLTTITWSEHSRRIEPMTRST